jgi:hypothetical protein
VASKILDANTKILPDIQKTVASMVESQVTNNGLLAKISEKTGLSNINKLTKSPGELLTEVSNNLRLKTININNPTLNAISNFSDNVGKVGGKILSYGVPIGMGITALNVFSANMNINNAKADNTLKKFDFIVPSNNDDLSVDKKEVMKLLGGAPSGSRIEAELAKNKIAGILPQSTLNAKVTSGLNIDPNKIGDLVNKRSFTGLEIGNGYMGYNNSGAYGSLSSVSQVVVNGVDDLMLVRSKASIDSARLINDTTLKLNGASSYSGVRFATPSGTTSIDILDKMRLGAAVKYEPMTTRVGTSTSSNVTGTTINNPLSYNLSAGLLNSGPKNSTKDKIDDIIFLAKNSLHDNTNQLMSMLSKVENKVSYSFVSKDLNKT